MAALAIWWCANALQALVLVRALARGFVTKYPIFYAYLSYVLLESLLRFYVYAAHPSLYQPFYWYTQLISVAVGCGVILEIYRRALANYPGAARMAQCLLLIIFLAVVCKAILNGLSGPVWSPAKTMAELERNLRTVQAVLLLAMLGVLSYYAIPVGRNLRGIIWGYALFIGTSVISLTIRSHLPDNAQAWWQYIQPVTYLISLVIWCVALWSYRPNPQLETKSELQRDYQSLAAGTARVLAHVRGYLERVVRS